MAKPRRRTVKRSANIRRVRLNSGGYDSRGKYWGSGKKVAPLYEVDFNGESYHVRAWNKGALKSYLNLFTNKSHSEVNRALDDYSRNQ